MTKSSHYSAQASSFKDVTVIHFLSFQQFQKITAIIYYLIYLLYCLEHQQVSVFSTATGKIMRQLQSISTKRWYFSQGKTGMFSNQILILCRASPPVNIYSQHILYPPLIQTCAKQIINFIIHLITQLQGFKRIFLLVSSTPTA